MIIDLKHIVERNRRDKCNETNWMFKYPPLPPSLTSVWGGGGYFHKLIVLAMLFVMPMVKALAWSQNSTLKDPKLMSMSPALKVIFPHGRVETLKHKYKKLKKSNYTFTWPRPPAIPITNNISQEICQVHVTRHKIKSALRLLEKNYEIKTWNTNGRY